MKIKRKPQTKQKDHEPVERKKKDEKIKSSILLLFSSFSLLPHKQPEWGLNSRARSSDSISSL